MEVAEGSWSERLEGVIQATTRAEGPPTQRPKGAEWTHKTAMVTPQRTLFYLPKILLSRSSELDD
jgi:hypothetical protein